VRNDCHFDSAVCVANSAKQIAKVTACDQISCKKYVERIEFDWQLVKNLQRHSVKKCKNSTYLMKQKRMN
jgi:hypothetical protein